MVSSLVTSILTQQQYGAAFLFSLGLNEVPTPTEDTYSSLKTLKYQTIITCENATNCSTRCASLLALPIEIHLYIFSFLDASSLCSLSKTCSSLDCISSHPLLWRALLLKYSLNCSVIGHLSHPQVYQDACSDLHPKRVYGRCYLNRGSLHKSSFTNFVTGRIKWLIGRLHGHVPKVLVFGSGMESLPFVRMLLWEKSSPFKPVGLYPGKEGVGSGVCIEHSDGSPVNLVTLYTSYKAEREEANSIKQSRQINRLTRSCDQNRTMELTHSVSHLCRQADAYMLIVDAETGPSGDMDRLLLNSMLQSGLAHTPLLVVGVTSNDCIIKLQPLHIADMLELCQLTHHPWQVRLTTLGTFSGLQEGLHWLIT